MNNDYTHYLKGLKYLDILNLEEHLSRISRSKILGDTIFIDLSQCLFAELGALAKLLLVIESYLKSSSKLYIALPTTKSTEGEIKSKRTSDEEKKQLLDGLLQKRRGVNLFLKRTGFVHAVIHIGDIYHNNILITESYDFEAKEINLASFEASFLGEYETPINNENGYNFLLPFKWIDCENGKMEIKNFEENLDRVLQHEDRGLESIDVKSIKNVVLSELTKNVFEHSKSKYAIFTIGLINSTSLTRSNRDKISNPVEKPYVEWITANNIGSQVEIYFGDSGIGILNKAYEDYIKSTSRNREISKNEQLLLAFQKWTTMKAGELRRGTKGLYRLHRLVKKYNGLIHIDSLGHDAGFFKDRPVSRNSKFQFLGTLINIKLNPYKQISAFSYTTEDSSGQQEKWVSDKFEINTQFNYVSTIGNYIRAHRNVLLLLDITDKDLSLEADRKVLENLFYDISQDAEPTKVVACLINRNDKIDNDTIDILINSVQTRIQEVHAGSNFPEIETDESEEISDPVLVLGDAHKAFWYGGSRELVDILDTSYAEAEPPNITTLEAFTKLDEKTQKQISIYLRSSSTLINLDDQFRVLFNFYGVEKHYEQTIAKEFTITENLKVCTPKLHLVEKWVDIAAVLARDEYGFALCLYLKYRKLIEDRNEGKFDIDKDNTFILIDSGQQYGLAKKFADLIGIRTKNIRNIESDIDFNIPKRTKLFARESSVVLLTTVISSSETVRRLVKYAKRDFAIPEAVLCLANFRKYNISQLETWSDTTQILSCFQKNSTNAEKVERNLEYFRDKKGKLSSARDIVNPTMDFDDGTPVQDIISIDKELLEFLHKKKLLHYNHYGVYNKRHFTFFLNKTGIVNAESFIWEKITNALDSWIQNIGSKVYSIYFNEYLINGDKAFHKFLKKKYGDKVHVLDKNTTTINSTHVAFLDFGILTGDSVNSFISKCYDVSSLFICLLFNQSINSNADIFRKIDQLKYFKSVQDDYGTTKFKITYLFHLPLNFFNSENCPICEHRRALDFFKIDHDYLSKFSEDRQEKLKQNLVDELMELSYPVDFYYSQKTRQQELSIDTIMQMYELKILLENARKQTKYRIELYNLVFDLYEKIDNEIQNSNSKVYSLIYYLSHEINWFQQEPFIFRDFRILISRIASTVAKLPIERLVEYFEGTNRYEIANKSLATRYKYSAISVLRSTDKLLFCREIYDIIESFTNSGRSSDNLLQNCLYHVSSLFKNSYNKSELYYMEIAQNLNKVRRELALKHEQKSAIENILSENAKIRGRAILVGKEPKTFKNMKEEWEGFYTERMPRHPLPYEEFKALALKQHKDLLELRAQKKALSPEEESTLREIKDHLQAHWNLVKNYIDNNIMFYLVDKLQLLTSGDYFRSSYSNSINAVEYNNNVEKFNHLLEEISSSMDAYLKNEAQYEELSNYFLRNYIQAKGLSDFSENAKILQLLSDFPTNINLQIDMVFPQEKFPKRVVSLDYNGETVSFEGENIFIYFPTSVLKLHFEKILQNIMEKKNNGTDLHEIDLRFFISISEAHMVHLNVSYDCTDAYLGPRNIDGSLAGFRKSIEQFGGSFSYQVPGGSSHLFLIHTKFMRYE